MKSMIVMGLKNKKMKGEYYGEQYWIHKNNTIVIKIFVIK